MKQLCVFGICSNSSFASLGDLLVVMELNVYFLIKLLQHANYRTLQSLKIRIMYPRVNHGAGYNGAMSFFS